jgi:hypothetical protein
VHKGGTTPRRGLTNFDIFYKVIVMVGGTCPTPLCKAINQLRREVEELVSFGFRTQRWVS